MEQFYLEIPSSKRKNEIIDYFDEFVMYNSDINGSGGLDKILSGYTFEQALDRCLNMRNEEYAKKLGRCQAKTFLLIRANDNKINLYLGLIEAQKLGLDKVMLDCDVKNLGSDKTILALGGILERTEVDPNDGILTNVYWIKVDESIKKYKETFNDKIYDK